MNQFYVMIIAQGITYAINTIKNSKGYVKTKKLLFYVSKALSDDNINGAELNDIISIIKGE
jgi:hypothetical protein